VGVEDEFGFGDDEVAVGDGVAGVIRFLSCPWNLSTVSAKDR